MLDCVLCALLIYVTWLFFGRRRAVPKAIIALLGANILIMSWKTSWPDPVLRAVYGVDNAETSYGLLAHVLWAAIWIPYFAVSRRVKATFVL